MQKYTDSPQISLQAGTSFVGLTDTFTGVGGIYTDETKTRTFTLKNK